MNAALPAGAGRSARHRAAGFTLMEVMVVVIIVAVLAGIGLPLYQDAMRKARRTDARESLLEAASRQEQYMLDRSTYTANMEDLKFESDPMISEEGHYSIDRVASADCALDSATCYVLQATPLPDSPQSDDEHCTSFTLASTGAQTATPSESEDCW